MTHHLRIIGARPLAVALGLAAAVTLPAAAQVQLAVGQSVQGQLAMSDLMWSDGARYDLYTFFGQAGQFVQIDMMSTDFDSYLILQGPAGNELARDDDGGGNLNSRITMSLPMPGVYRIIAKSLSSGRYGNYMLQLSGSGGMPVVSQAMPMANPSGVVGTIGPNQQVAGMLTQMDARWDNKPFQAYQFTCAAGQAFQMDILSSWDNYGLVFDPMGNIAARDDDTGEGLNARINYTCPMAGIYRLAVTAYSTSTTPGAYTMQVTSAGAPMMMAQPMPIQPGVTLPQPVQAMPITGGIPAPGAVGALQVGQMAQGRLEPGDQTMNDGTWADIWTFNGMAGQTVTIELRSEEFDTYLQLLDAGGNRLAEDDDSGGNLDSRVVFTLPTMGQYQLVVNNFGDTRRAGVYTISVR